MASPTSDNIRVAIRVRPLIKRENDFHSQFHWRVDKNTITQVINGKLMPNSSYIFDRIFDISNSTQDVYDEFGRPTVLSAMDGFNGTLFAYGQTSSGKTYTMMGDQRNEGVIPKAVGEIYDYIEKHPSREFLIRVSYMEIYNEDIKDLLNPAKTNLKIHENPQRQVYVGDLTEEVVSCGEDVFKHMLRGEKNRHFGETNMNDRSSRSHTIFRVVIESREMKDESKDPDTIDGAVRVAHLNLVDLAGSERASQTGAFGQRLKEGGHINKSLLALGSVIAKLSEGESFIPFRDSKLTRILQSSLGGNAKTSMICTITPAAVEETISTLKFASRAKTIKNCPEVNEVLDDGTLLKRYRKEICELKKQLTQMSQQSTISQMQELQIEKEKMVEMLEQQRIQQSEQEEKIKRLRNMICSAGKENETKGNKARMAKRRETWCPGAALSKAPLASASALADMVQTRLQRISSSPSSEESEFDEMPKEAFLSRLEIEEERKSNEFNQKRVGFASPQAKRCLSPVLDTELEDKDMQTEPDQRITELENKVKKLSKNLDEAIQTRDLYNDLLVESNDLLEKMSTEKGLCPASTSSDITLKYVAELRNEKANLETEVEVLKTQCLDLEHLKARNKELEDQIQSLENERSLSNEYLSELHAEYDGVQAEKQALAARVEALENTGAFNTATKMELDSLHVKLEASVQEKEQLSATLESWKEKCVSLEGEVARLQSEFEQRMNFVTEEASATKKLEDEVQQLRERLSSADDQEQMLTDMIEQKFHLEEYIENLKAENAQNKEIFEEKCSNEAQFEQFKAEKEAEIAQLETELRQLQQQLKETSTGDEENKAKVAQVLEQKREVEENFETFKADKESELAKVYQEIEALRDELKEKVCCIEERECMLTGAVQQRCDAEERLEKINQEMEQIRAEMHEKLCRIEEEESMLTEAVQQRCEGEETLEKFKEDNAKLTQEIEEIRAEIEEKLCSIEEKESMLTEVIQQKCELEEKFKLFKEERDNEATQLIQEIEQLRNETQIKGNGVDEKESLLNECSQKKCTKEESFDKFKQEKENQIAKLVEEVELLQRELNKTTLSLQEKENLLMETVNQKCEFDTYKLEKENEVQKLTDGIRELEVQLCEKTSTVEEKENLLNEMIQLRCEAEENLKIFRQQKESEIEGITQQLQKIVTERDYINQTLDSEDKQVMLLKANVSDLKVQLEKTIHEKKELEHMLERVKKERDEIKNDLSESITDSAELQKDVFDMHQKVKRYKEHIHELESQLGEKEVTITMYKEKIETLQYQGSQRAEQPSVDITHESTSDGDHSEHDNLKSQLCQEKDRTQEIAEECKVLKSCLEELENAKEVLVDEREKLQQEADELRGKLRDFEKQLSDTEEACKMSEQRLQEEQDKCEKLVKELEEYKLNECHACKGLEQQLADSRQAQIAAEKQLEGERVKYEKIVKELEQCKSTDCHTRDRTGSVPFEMELLKVTKENEELVKELTEEKRAHETLRKEHSSLSEELQHLRDSLLRDTNRGMDQQRVIDKMKAERRETICVQAHQRQELEKDLCEAEKKVSELESHCTLLKSEKDVLEHRLEVANKKVEETKQEMRDMENIYCSHNTRAVTQLDDNKAMQKLKQMEFSVDLTKQKCEKAEARVKELEHENRQLRGADIRNGALLEERDNLKQQVQQAKQVLDEKSRKLNEFSIQVTQLQAHVDKVSEENKKNRSSLEKKEKKIDDLEEKLWHTEEELKLERQRCQEQQSQGMAVEELNSTIRVKHEELEHMTFLVDEKDIEIAEVRSSLQENENKQLEMAEMLRQKEEQLDELQHDLDRAHKDVLEARTGQEEADAKILELKAIIKQQESELIALNERIESEKAEGEIETQELGAQTQRLQDELQDVEHKLLEVESELEFTKNTCEKAVAEKQKLMEFLEAYVKVLNDDCSADSLNLGEECLITQFGPDLEKVSSRLKTAKEVEDINNKLKGAIEGKRLLEVKLDELQASAEEQRTALDEEIEELRESLLNEKKLVFELEDKVKFAENDKNEMEAELRQVLEERKTNDTKDDMDMKMATIVNSESELHLELEKEKEKAVQLESEIRRLKEEMVTWESLAESRSVAVEEEKKAWDNEMARCTERFEEEKQQLLEQLREISALKVRESEDFCSEKDEKIEELENKLLNATKAVADYKHTLEHYQLKLAKAEYELDTTVERLEKQNSTSSTDNSEMESLKKECEMAKKKCKEAQEKYFSESDRLKAIIDEMQDEQDEFVRQLNELKDKTAVKDAEMCQLRNELAVMKKKAQAATNSASSTDNSEMESLKKECEVAKKKCKEAQEKYFSESDRLKAIIDEMQDEQDEFVRQLNELKDKTAVKDSELCQLRNELTEMRKIAQVASNSTSSADSSEMESLKKECEVAKKKCKEAQEKYFSESDRLKAIIDEMQDEQDEFLLQLNELKDQTAKKDAEMCRLQNELADMKKIAQAAAAQNTTCSMGGSEVEYLKKECEALKNKAREAQEKFLSESDRLKAIIREHQEIINKGQRNEDTGQEMEATRIDLAEKNMQIQSLQYDLYKLQEKYDKETRALTKEVDWGREKVGSLKLEIRRLKEPETEDTICMMRGQPVPAKKAEGSDVGVVSNVAIYSLKAKVGKLESETEKLNKKLQQLEREKATLSLLNTEASNKVAQLTSENKALKTHRKKLMEEAQKRKACEGDSKLKADSGRRLPEVPTETLEKESRNSSILSLSTLENVSVPIAEHKRSKPEATKEHFQNWLSEDAANNMFKDEPNQCANQ